jgi:TonB family protein
MRRKSAFAIAVLYSACLAAGQQVASPAPQTSEQNTTGSPASQTVYYSDVSGLTPPQLIPLGVTGNFAAGCKKIEANIVFSAVVEPDGTAHNIKIVQQTSNRLDEVALKLAQADHFMVGMRDGAAVSVAVLLEVDLTACIEEKKDEAGSVSHVLRLETAPAQILEVQPPPNPAPPAANGDVPSRPSGSGASAGKAKIRVSPPVLTHWVQAGYPDPARKAKFEGICLIGLTVDVNGQPQNVHVTKSLSPGLDQKAIEAVEQYRFKPAIKNGTTPVPVPISIEVGFGSD